MFIVELPVNTDSRSIRVFQDLIIKYLSFESRAV